LSEVRDDGIFSKVHILRESASYNHLKHPRFVFVVVLSVQDFPSNFTIKIAFIIINFLKTIISIMGIMCDNLKKKIDNKYTQIQDQNREIALNKEKIDVDLLIPSVRLVHVARFR